MEGTEHRSSRRWRRRALIAAGVGIAVLVLYGALGGWLLPRWLRPRVEAQLTAATGLPASIEALRINPFAGTATIESLRLGPADDPMLSLERAYGDLDVAGSAFRAALVLDSASVVRLRLQVVRDATGRVDVVEVGLRAVEYLGGVDALRAFFERLPDVILHDLALEAGAASYRDEVASPPFETELTPVSFTVRRFSTRREGRGNLAFTAESESGETFGWAGELSRQPLAVTGTVSVAGLRLGKYAPMAREFLPLSTTGGRADLRARYEVGFDDAGEPYARLTQGHADVAGAGVRWLTEAEAFCELDAVRLDGVRAAYPEFEASVETLAVAGGHLDLWIDSTGGTSLDPLLALLPRTSTRSVPLRAAVETSSVVNVVVNATHRRPGGLDGQLSARVQTARVGRLAWPPDPERAPVDVRLDFTPAGALTFHGDVGLAPPSVRGDAEVTGLSLAFVGPYLASLLDAKLRSGRLSWAGEIAVALQPELAAALDGVVDLDELNVVAGSREDGIGWRTLRLDPLKIQLEPSPRPLSAPPTDRWRLKAEMGHVELVGSRVDLEGWSSPQRLDVDLGPVLARIDQVRVEGRGGRSPARDAFHYGPVTIEAGLRPFAPRTPTRFTVDLWDADLPPFSAISERYAGHVLEAGTLDAELRYRVVGMRLRGRNRIIVRGLELGDRVDSPDAVKLPVKLGVALLKDRNGIIDLELDVEGRLDDPSFSIGRAVADELWQAVGRVVAGPFAALGAVFERRGGPAVVPFAAGTSTTSLDARAQLRKVEAALGERTELVLEVRGGWDAVEDGRALARAAGPSAARDDEGPAAPTPSDARLRALADARAAEVRAVLIEGGRVEPARIVVATSTLTDAPEVRLRLDVR